jgi:hypothetical protein
MRRVVDRVGVTGLSGDSWPDAADVKSERGEVGEARVGGWTGRRAEPGLINVMFYAGER